MKRSFMAQKNRQAFGVPAAAAWGRLLAEGFLQVGKLARRAEIVVPAGDELGIFIHENLARRAEVELARLVAEELPVDAGPDKPSVGVDVDLGDAELRGRKVFV